MEITGQFNRLLPPFNFKGWIEENRHLLKPPVANKVIYKEGNFIIQVVGGPNSRTDFHVNQTDEFFYQLEGTMFLRVINAKGSVEEIHVKEGDIFLLPGGVPHSPQRAENSVGLVIEKARQPDDTDGLLWVCSKCHKQLYSETFHLENIETQFSAVFERFYNSDHVKCSCGHVNGRVW
ncbi:MAG: 3-hydroxyanthranilate 3,4-dioxygenase [Bacteriovorax sp.]|nr:3-hydroxyanthranilate 3,4-dioxygenase [Bacteriovorax sp.]